MVSKWSVSLFGYCPPMKWHKKALLNCSKLLMDDAGNFVNHSLAALLRVVRKEWHSISSGGCWRYSVILKVLRWSRGSLSSSNNLSWGRWNNDGTGHSRTVVVKAEYVVLTILSRLRFVFPLMAFLSLSISFLISRNRFEFGSSNVVGPWWSLLLWLSPSSSWLALDWFSSCWGCILISWFCLVCYSTIAAKAWTWRTNAARSLLDSIWIYELIGN